MKNVTIIGAGFGGIASAALLAKEGFEVDVYEKNPIPGGRAGQLKDKGFTFDTGPSWLLMPDVFRRFFKQIGKDFDSLPIKKLDPQYKIFWEGGNQLLISSSYNQTRESFESIEKGAGRKLDEYMEDAKLKYDVGVGKVIYKNKDGYKGLLDRDLILNATKLNPHISMHSHIKKYFKDEKLRQILEYSLVFLGCSPYNAPSLFSLMNYSDFKLGTYYIDGGIYKLVEEIVRIGKKYGAKYHFNSNVEKIVTVNGEVKKIVVDGKTNGVDILVSNADYKFTEDILDNQSLRNFTKSYWEKKVMNPSAFILFLGIRSKLPMLEHHNLFFSNDWEEHFSEVFENKSWPKNPSMYINMPTKIDKSLAPKDKSTLMILIPVAPGLKDTRALREKFKRKIYKTLAKSYGVHITNKIEYERLFSVNDFTEKYNSYQGNAFGGIAHTLTQSLIWRPNNVSKNISNMFFVGASTVPGIGVPSTLVSAELLYERIKNHESR